MDTKENRQAKRHLIKLPVILVDKTNNKTYNGITKEVSKTGLSFLSECNVFLVKDVAIILKFANETIEVTGSMIYTYHASNDRMFRTGIVFKCFKEGDKAKLAKFLGN